MAIKAVLMKNSLEIREKIKLLGFSCTEDPNSYLYYNESNSCVSWDYRTTYPSNVINCKTDENLFFQLLQLKTIGSETEIVEELKYYKNKVDWYKKELTDTRLEYNDYLRNNQVYSELVKSLNENLEILQKENNILKTKIQELEKAKNGK